VQQKFTTLGTYLIAGLLGGAISRMLPTAVPVALAQSQKKEDAKVIRAERIELVNNRGTPLAVFDVRYSSLTPAGSPMLTLTDREVLQNHDRKVVISTGTSSMKEGDTESLIFGAGMIMVGNRWGWDTLGMLPEGSGSHNGLLIGHAETPERLTTLNGAGVFVSAKDGSVIASLP
jgi:hypothetical protein